MTGRARPPDILGYPLVSLLFGLLVGALAVIIVGGNPFVVYKQLATAPACRGSLQWIPGNPFGVTVREARIAETNLISTIVSATPAVLAGCSVGFAFRCGLFNIGAGGQLVMGAIAVVHGRPLLGGGVAGMVLASIAGVLAASSTAPSRRAAGLPRSARGDLHDHAQLRRDPDRAVPGRASAARCRRRTAARRSPRSSTRGCAGRTCGASSRPGAHRRVRRAGRLVVYWIVLERTTLGYEVRAVGFNPEAARFGGISVPRAVVLAMGIAGAFAGPRGLGRDARP